MEYRLTAPMTREQARQLRCGDTVLFTGTIYTARDAAHKRLVELLDKGEPLPFDVNGAVIYYAGPTRLRRPCRRVLRPHHQLPHGRLCPQSHCRRVHRHDRQGQAGRGRGQRHERARSRVLCRHWWRRALLARCVKKAEVVAYEDLGAEAIRRMEVVDFPVTVVIDTLGQNLYEAGQKAYLASLT